MKEKRESDGGPRDGRVPEGETPKAEGRGAEGRESMCEMLKTEERT